MLSSDWTCQVGDGHPDEQGRRLRRKSDLTMSQVDGLTLSILISST